MGWVNSADTLYQIEHSMLGACHIYFNRLMKLGADLRGCRSVTARSSAPSSNTETDIYPLCQFQCCSSTFIFSTIATFYVGWTGARDTWWFFIKRRRCAFTFKHSGISLSNLAPTQDDLYEYCFRVRRTIQEVLTEFRSAKIPKEYIFDLFPPMRPREFSIASSIKVSPPCLKHFMINTFSFPGSHSAIRTRYIYVLQSLNIEQSWGYQGEECVRHSWQPCTLVYWTVLS